MKNCSYCNKPLEAKRATKKFCNDKCRLAKHYSGSLPVTIKKERSRIEFEKDQPKYLSDLVNAMNLVYSDPKELAAINKMKWWELLPYLYMDDRKIVTSDGFIFRLSEAVL